MAVWLSVKVLLFWTSVFIVALASLKLLSKLKRDVERLSVYVRNVNIENSDFLSVCFRANNGDFIYSDPSYYYDRGDGHAVYNTNRVDRNRTPYHPRC